MSDSRILLVTAIALGLCACLSCLREDIVRPDRNRPPETVLTVGPNMGSEVDHKYIVRWSGFDRDGIVVGYFVALVSERQLYGGFTSEGDRALYIATLDWHYTTSTESLFVFRADNPTSREYSLYVRAIDNEGKLDPTPAAVNFTAVNYLRPDPIIELSTSIDTVPRIPPPKGDTIPAYYPGDDPYRPIKIFVNWRGEDPDGEILSWKFTIDNSPWEIFSADTTSKIFIYYPDNRYGKSDVYLGTHEVRIQALDDAYSLSPDKPKSALFVINYDPESIIDSVWSFRRRDARVGTVFLDTILIYPYHGEGYPVAYQFGQLIIKFHAIDRDNHPDSLPPRWFKWEIYGTGIKSGGDTTDGWVSNFSGSSGEIYYYSDVTPFYENKLYYEPAVYRLLLRARDHLGKVEATAAKFSFKVNYPPKITALKDSVTKVIGDSLANVKFSWDVYDPDEGDGFGWAGQYDYALVKYEYRVDDGDWVRVEEKEGPPKKQRYKKTAEVPEIPFGTHTFELKAYNGSSSLTAKAKDESTLVFTVP